jgi:hypothetical protein
MQVFPRSPQRAMRIQLNGEMQIQRRILPLFTLSKGGCCSAMFFQPYGRVQKRSLLKQAQQR